MDYFHDLEKDKFQTLSCESFTTSTNKIHLSHPKTFDALTGYFIFPLTLATLSRSYFTCPLVRTSLSTPWPDYLNLLILPAVCDACLFVFAILSIATVTFSVSCAYASRPVSFSSVSVVPHVLKGLLVTFSLYYTSMFVCEVAFYYFLVQFFKHPLWLMMLLSLVIMLGIYLMTLWQLATVVSVMEPTLYGFAALRKSYELLKGRTKTALGLSCVYLVGRLIFTFIFYEFTAGGADYVSHVLPSAVSWTLRAVIGIFSFGMLMCCNFDSLLTETMFYFSCKSYHNQEMDKTTLYDYLGGYLGSNQGQEEECEPLANKEVNNSSKDIEKGTETSNLDPVVEQATKKVIEIKILDDHKGVDTRRFVVKQETKVMIKIELN